MRVWRTHELGEPADVMKLESGDAPSAGPGQVVLDIHAVGLSFPDILQCRGGYQVKPALPFTLGGEVAGVVSAIGEGVTSARVGDHAAASTGGGGLAEQVAIRADRLLPITPSVEPAKAAAMISNYTTSYFALHDRAALQPGETLLVTAGAGGVGSSAIQLGVAAGARVFATAGGAEKVRICEQLGAEVAIDYESEDLVERVRELTDGRGVDVVYDPVGADVFDDARRTVAWNGRYLVIGFAGGRIPNAPMNHVLLKNYSIVGVHWGAAAARDPQAMPRTYATLIDLYKAGRIDPLIYREPVPLDAAADALTMLASRQTWGKVVVDPSR
jgi:NADPH2:quinone reductase